MSESSYEPMKRYFEIEGVPDPEIQAIKIITEMLDELTKEQQENVLKYIESRYAEREETIWE